MWRTCEHVSGPCRLCSSFPCAVDLRGNVGFFCRRIVLYWIVLSSMMLFKRSFGITRSLFILYVHGHDRLGFGVLTVETAVFDCICWFSSSRNRKGQPYLVEYCLESVEEYSRGKILKSEPESRNEDINTVYFVNQAKWNMLQSHGVRRDCTCLPIFERPT